MTVIVLDSEDRRAYALRIIGQIKIDPPLDVTIVEHVDKRSNEQNARLWLLHTAAANHVGCSSAEMHEEMLCEHFGFNEVRFPNGSIRRIPIKRSSARNKKEFHAYMEFVENYYASELQVFLP